ncbi:MAG TPA: hypothetical protein VKV29_04850 [Chthonomonas sp.]|jgi:predicted component of type VI protein secretion system|uniref:hypothetical protein n=1 Tax=Chthonomonas sp. TaxID=2282153 RepID=UPI002B4B014C|nr:hypothetical protein [Chthonomonas sp.]HLH79593.1 hypothetical protein [Chthonomonas sp.]
MTSINGKRKGIVAASLLLVILAGCNGQSKPSPDNPNAKMNAMRTRPSVNGGPSTTSSQGSAVNPSK